MTIRGAPHSYRLSVTASIVGSVVECSPATRAARVRFPDDAETFFPSSLCHPGRDPLCPLSDRHNCWTVEEIFRGKKKPRGDGFKLWMVCQFYRLDKLGFAGGLLFDVSCSLFPLDFNLHWGNSRESPGMFFHIWGNSRVKGRPRTRYILYIIYMCSSPIGWRIFS